MRLSPSPTLIAPAVPQVQDRPMGNRVALAVVLPAACSTAAGFLIVLAVGRNGWDLWPVALYGVGLAIGWWPMRPKPGMAVWYSTLVIAALAQAAVFALVAMPLALPAVYVPQLAHEVSIVAPVFLGSVLIGCPLVGLLSIVGARGSAILAATQLLVPFALFLLILASVRAPVGPL